MPSSSQRRHKSQNVYLDNNATTDVDPKVRTLMNLSLKQFCGNPSSAHTEGTSSRQTVETCRQACAQMLNCQPEEMYFTSGATEANNIVLLGFIQKALQEGRRPRILCSPLEHVSVLNPLRHYQHAIDLVECPVTQAPHQPHGSVDPEAVERLIVEHHIELVTIALVNHEIGTVQSDLQRIAQFAHRHGAFVHSDYTQAVGKFPVLAELDAISFSAHKFYGPKGVGGLMLRQRARPHIHQIMFGGDQEMKLRPGTENVLGIVGLTAALELTLSRREQDQRHLDRLARRFFRGLKHHHVAHQINSASHIALNVTFPESKLTSDELIQKLSSHGICVSKGAACKSRTKHESYVLAAVGIVPQGPTIRIGIGRFNRPSDLDTLVQTLRKLL